MPLFAVIGWDRLDEPNRRDPHREEHIAHVSDLDRKGRIVLAGPIRSEDRLESIGVLIVLEADDLDEARDTVARDPYVTGGVFESLTVSPFEPVFPKQS